MVNKPFWHISNFVLASYTFGCVKMSNFVPNNRHLQEVLILFFHSKKTAAEAHRELQKVYWDAALSETTFRDWFRRFKNGDFYVDDRLREGRPKTFEDVDLIYYHWGTISNAIDAFEPSTVRKTATKRGEARKSDSTAWQRSASRCQTR